jgi:hypothetical protein
MAFERDWDETTPNDTTEANQIDDFNRNVRKDLRERLAVDHSFTSSDTGKSVGEGQLGMHKQVTLIETADIGTGAEGQPILGAQTVSGKAELLFTDEDDNDIQVTAAGNIGGASIELLAGKDLLGSATSDITITDKFTVAGATGNTVVAGTLDVTGIMTTTAASVLGDGSTLAAATESGDGDRTIADKAYVDSFVGSSYRLVDVDGTPTKVFAKYLTGLLDADDTTEVAHGVSTALTKILAVTVAAFEDSADNGYSVIGIRDANIPNSRINVFFDATYVVFKNVGSNYQGNGYKIKVEYIL